MKKIDNEILKQLISDDKHLLKHHRDYYIFMLIVTALFIIIFSINIYVYFLVAILWTLLHFHDTIDIRIRIRNNKKKLL